MFVSLGKRGCAKFDFADFFSVKKSIHLKISQKTPLPPHEKAQGKKVQQVITSIKRSGSAIMGNISTPVSGKIKSANHKIRNDLGNPSKVYLMPMASIKSHISRFKGG